MKVFSATVTSKGQLTIPVEVRRLMGLKASDKVVITVTAEGTVELKRSQYPDLMSLRGMAGSLPEPMSWDEMIRIAREDALLEDDDAYIVAAMQASGTSALYSWDKGFDRIPGINRIEP